MAASRRRINFPLNAPFPPPFSIPVWGKEGRKRDHARKEKREVSHHFSKLALTETPTVTFEQLSGG